MTVICPQWNTFDIACDQSIRENISSGQTAYFIFQNDFLQDVTFTASSSTFESKLQLRDSVGHYIDATTHSNDTLIMDELVHGLYTLELTPNSLGGTFTVETMCNSTTITENATIECGGAVSGDIKRGETLFIEFNNTKSRNVLFTNCPKSHEDTSYFSLFLRNSSGTYVQSKSTNECDGTDCFFAYGYCNNTIAESFMMQNLPPDIYMVELSYGVYS